VNMGWVSFIIRGLERDEEEVTRHNFEQAVRKALKWQLGLLWGTT
jgi:hypothetical protein